MKKNSKQSLLKLNFFFILCFALFSTTTYAEKISDEKAKEIFEKAIFIPHQAFQDAKTLYVKTMTNAINRVQAWENAEDEMQEYWKEGNKIRWRWSESHPSEAHIIFDGKIITNIYDRYGSDYHPRDVETGSVDGKTYTTSNWVLKIQTEATEEDKNLFGNGTNIYRGEGIKYNFIGTEKVGDYKCYVISISVDKSTVVAYIDKKTNVIVKMEDSSNITEVKKIEKINGKFIPVVVEDSMSRGRIT